MGILEYDGFGGESALARGTQGLNCPLHAISMRLSFISLHVPEIPTNTDLSERPKINLFSVDQSTETVNVIAISDLFS